MTMRPTKAQVEKLVEYMEQHPPLARNELRSITGRFETKENWLELSNILNSMGDLQKSPKQWTRFWADKKYKIKMRLIANNRAAHRQGSVVQPVPPALSQLDRRIHRLVWGNESSNKTQRELRATRRAELADESQPGPASSNVMHEGSQTDVTTLPRRTRRVWVRRQRKPSAPTEWQRLIDIEERRIAVEIAQARSICKAMGALKKLATAILRCGNNIAERFM